MLSLSLGSFAFTAFINLVCVYACQGIQKSRNRQKGMEHRFMRCQRERGDFIMLETCIRPVRWKFSISRLNSNYFVNRLLIPRMFRPCSKNEQKALYLSDNEQNEQLLIDCTALI
jgi:hypothetical protein